MTFDSGGGDRPEQTRDMDTSAAGRGAAPPTSQKRPIIVGVDGSASSREALSWAVHQAHLLETDVRAVIAWNRPAASGLYAVTDEVDWGDDARQTLEAAVTQALGDDTDDVTTSVVRGHPAQVLVDVSAEAELLVVGNRGRGGFAEALLGSVSEHVVRHAACPVVVVREHTLREPGTAAAEKPGA